MKNNEAIVQQESKLKCKDGSVKTVLINSNVLWENGEFKHTRCFTTDITERKKIQETLEISESNYRVKSDFMYAKGVLDVFKTPYFHFQEYKPHKNPTGDSMAQLLQAFLIAQEKNKNGKPLYGVDIIGKQWSFVTMEGKDYCISKAFDSVDESDLLIIIAVLRKFKDILLNRLVPQL